jgi:hypothetical protein
MVVLEAAMIDRGKKGAREATLFGRSGAMTNTVAFNDVLLEPKEAAEFLKISLSWLAKARATSEGPPFIRIGRCVRYSRVALVHWLKCQQQ